MANFEPGPEREDDPRPLVSPEEGAIDPVTVDPEPTELVAADGAATVAAGDDLVFSDNAFDALGGGGLLPGARLPCWGDIAFA